MTKDLTHAPSLDQLFAVVDATWPAAATVQAGPWLLREGRGGGKRVSAATATGRWREDDLGAAEQAMRMMGQTPLFMIRPGDEALDTMLAQQGYDIIDPVHIRLVPARQLTDRRIPPVTAFTVWEPLAIMREIWEEGGIGEARQQVMERAPDPKTGLFGRVSDSPGGTGFCGIHDGIAMVHALEILPHHRQKGLGGWMMRAAAFWAVDNGADWLALVVTKANTGANALYASLGMEVVGEYHYRILPDPEGPKT
ncbi:GNAT family N-acetyltransferase [Tropicibacter oceani]|uniref:GNAT family N-acetyltransferase n=1 Tax=Tropicibacter oceani TaxID=3058420 RepID=A0ABY8QLT3_9RHOB|nr:GNAT family N-acetyltransferase [Tropicibacter oceani]WGW04893.1 GNAT family N-acetyltransferase [Tropicibacter oceani]